MCSGPKGEDLGSLYREYFRDSSTIEVLAVDWPIAEEAARIRSAYRLRTPDAIQIATAIVAEADVFITNDRALVRVSEISVVLFDEWSI